MRGKAKRDAGRKGGRAGKGESKARMGIQNGNTSLDQDRHATWRVIDVPFEVFAELLELLHHNRLAKKSKPWLRFERLPKHICEKGYEDLAVVLELLNGTKFGHPDRYMDRVSKEILAAMRQHGNTRFCFPGCVLKVGQARQVPELPIEPKKGILNMHAYQKGSSKLEFRNHWDNTLLNYRPANPPTNRRVRNSRSRLFGFLAGEGRKS